MRAQITPPVRRLLDVLSGAGPRIDDPVAAAADAAAAGCLVALEHGSADDPAAGLRDLVARVAGTGLAGACELTVPVDRLGAAAAGVARAAAGAGLGVALEGTPAAVDALAAAVGTATVVVRATADAEDRCRALAAGRVRLTAGRGAAADLAFVRCLNVLMSGSGHPAVGTTDPRLVAIAGERAAWNDRDPDSWEYVMPWQVRSEQQRRLVAGGYRVRVVLRSGGRS